MSYPKDLDEYTVDQLYDELRRRGKLQAEAKCDYCERKWFTDPSCKFPERHQGKDRKEGWHSTDFIDAFTLIEMEVHNWAQGKGFWEEGKKRNKGEMIALMHSELSEALEAIRIGNPPDDKIPDFSGAEAEFADTIIRIMDMP